MSKYQRKRWPYFAEWARKEADARAGHTGQLLAEANRELLLARESLKTKPDRAEALIMHAAHLLSEARVDQEIIRRILTEAREGLPDEDEPTTE